MLKINNIHKQYEGEALLRGVSFEVGSKETVCLLGQSGGGKSTILRIIAGLEDAESGQVIWTGNDLEKIPAHERHFGLMFQDFALFPHLIVYDNVAFGLQVKDLNDSAINHRVKEVLELVGLGAFTQRSVIDLSGGEKQRVAFARAIAPQPALLMLDEPMGALDRVMRDQLLKDLKELLAAADIPVIYVTHDQGEAFAIADRILVLHEGEIKQSGTPQSVFSLPETLWIANFLGHKNLLSGRVKQQQPLLVETEIGDLITAIPGDKLQIGEQVDLLVTDADLRANQRSDPNTFEAHVSACRFLGLGYQVQARFLDGYQITFEVDNAYQIGQHVFVTINPSALLCYVNGKLHENCKE